MQLNTHHPSSHCGEPSIPFHGLDTSELYWFYKRNLHDIEQAALMSWLIGTQGHTPVTKWSSHSKNISTNQQWAAAFNCRSCHKTKHLFSLIVFTSFKHLFWSLNEIPCTVYATFRTGSGPSSLRKSSKMLPSFHLKLTHPTRTSTPSLFSSFHPLILSWLLSSLWQRYPLYFFVHAHVITLAYTRWWIWKWRIGEAAATRRK